jgi:hypothetical protein
MNTSGAKIQVRTLQEIINRMREIDMKLMSMSYSQSNPGQMMDRRMLRKEKEQLSNELDELYIKKKD